MKREIAALMVGVFIGYSAHANINRFRAIMPYKVEEGFFGRPYDLEILIKENAAGRKEVYLHDKRLCIMHSVDEELYVGNAKHRIKGVINIYKEELGDTIRSLIEEAYDILF